MFSRRKPKKIYKFRFEKDSFDYRVMKDVGYVNAVREACVAYNGELISVKMDYCETCKFVVKCTESAWYCIVESLLDSVGRYMKNIKY